MKGIIANEQVMTYFDSLKEHAMQQVDTANKARAKGLDYAKEIETKPVSDLADRAETIIGPPGIAKRYRKLINETQGDNKRLRVIFQLFRELIEQEWYEIPDDSKRVEQAIKTALVLNTEGVVVAPIDGVPKVLISKNPDGSNYIDIYYAGPIRAAGGTSQVMPLILGDYARKLMGVGRYMPTKDEVERYVEENQIYESLVSRQYKLSDDEARKIIQGCPVCINGEPTEQREVSVHRDLARVPDNRVRGGACLVLSEGIGLKAKKILKFSKMLDLDWSWLEQIIKHGKEKTENIEPKAKYLEGTAAGRPILGYPSRFGGFRLRYGRTRGTGIMCKAMHPASLSAVNGFIAIGTQIKVERPGKAGGISACDSIEGPIVLLKDGTVKQLRSRKEADEINPLIEEILFLGDLLIAYGDFRYSAHRLIPVGYNEEWWALELKKAAKGKKINGINLNKAIEKPREVNLEDAVKISRELNVPLHPKCTQYTSTLKPDEVLYIIGVARTAEKIENGKSAFVPFKEKTKALFEKIGLEHKIQGKKLLVENALGFLTLFGAFTKEKIEPGDTLLMLRKASGLRVRDKSGSWIGVRMGRPEAASPRKMKGNPHTLFPVGNYGGNIRSINKAMQFSEQHKGIEVQISAFHCGKCNSIAPFSYCPKCGSRTKKANICTKCNSITKEDKCRKCGSDTRAANKRKIKIEELVHSESQRMGIKVPELIKGVRGIINEEKIVEPIGKGLLRARHDLHIFRDGTIRYELINNPLTHFKPSEINASLEKLKELGYEKDIHGKPITDSSQIIEIFPQDVIVPEETGDFFVGVTRFLDEELEKFYGLKPHFNAKNRNDLIGELILGLAPHTSAAIIGRILGFNNTRACFAHPYFHQTKRRNCLKGSTPILLLNEGKIKNIPIKALDNGESKEIIPLKGLSTFTVDEHGRLKKEKIKALFKKRAPKNLLKIKTAFGRSLTVTPKQKMLFENNGKASIKLASELREGDRLLSLAKIEPERQVRKINVLEWYLENASQREKKHLRVHNVRKKMKKQIEKLGGCWMAAKKINYRKWLSAKKQGKTIYNAIWFDSVPLELFEKILAITEQKARDFGNVSISYNKQKSRIPATIKLDRKLGEVIGYFLADGYARTTDNKKREKYVYQINLVSAEKEIIKRLKGHIRKIFKRQATSINAGNVYTLTLSGRVYYDFFTKILNTGKGARDKRLPFQLLNAPTNCVEGCIAGYIAGDGSIDYNSINASSVNQQLLNDFSILLARLGVFAHLSETKRRTIKTGCVSEFYRKRGKKISVKSYTLRLYSEDFKRVAQILFDRKKNKAEKVLKTHRFTKKRAKKLGNFVLDRIKSIKTVRSREKYVYDLIVEGKKTFIGGMGNLAIYDCDGDQDSIMLLMDGLLNFSQAYLPSSRGGRMDAPLVFTIALRPNEIDTEVYEMDTAWSYPLELYEKAMEFAPAEIKGLKIVEHRLGKPEQYSGFGFTHSAAAFADGPRKSKYVELGSMESKVFAQAKLQSKIRAVDLKDSLERVVITHFMPDIIGNTRSFCRQVFRCTNCNTKYRRLPLSGQCTACDKGNIILTIAPGSVVKYLKIVKKIVKTYELSDYLSQRIDLIEEEIDSVLHDESMTQKSLGDFV